MTAAQLTCISPITDELALLLGILGRWRENGQVDHNTDRYWS